MSIQKKKGFTLIELMVVIVIIGILAAIAIPKLFGMTAKAKAQEVGPAAGTWIKLQSAFIMETGGYGDFEHIGYTPPGNLVTPGNSNVSRTAYFKYTGGETGGSPGDPAADPPVPSTPPTHATWNAINDQGVLGNGCDKNDLNTTLSFAASGSPNSADVPDIDMSGVSKNCCALIPNFPLLGKVTVACSTN